MRSTYGKSGLDHIPKLKWVGSADLGSSWVRVRGGSWDGHQGRDSGSGNGGGGGNGNSGKKGKIGLVYGQRLITKIAD